MSTLLHSDDKSGSNPFVAANDISDSEEFLRPYKQQILEGISGKLKWKAQRIKIVDDLEAMFQATRIVVVNAGMPIFIR